MTALVSIRLDDGLFHEMKAKAHILHLTQTDYIKEAIKYMNHKTEKQKRRERLKRASLRTRKESMKVNAEFSRIDDVPKA